MRLTVLARTLAIALVSAAYALALLRQVWLAPRHPIPRPPERRNPWTTSLAAKPQPHP
jgi:hypothetical protein